MLKLKIKTQMFNTLVDLKRINQNYKSLKMEDRCFGQSVDFFLDLEEKQVLKILAHRAHNQET